MPCPLCGCPTDAAFTARDRNRAITGLAFRYRLCPACRSLHLENVPEDLGAYYPPEYYSLPTLDELRASAVAESYRLEFVRRHAGGGRLTEIGPGNGIFAIQALDAGFDTAAIEMDGAACAYVREMLGIEVIESDIPQVPLATMTPSRVIVAWHALEHLRRPWAVLDAAAANLEPGGVFIIATPNPRAFGLRILGPRWPHVDAPRHLFLIDCGAIASRAASLGLEVVELTDVDKGGLHWNAFAWHFLLRRPGWSRRADGLAHMAGRAIGGLLAPVERRGLRGAAYTIVLRKR